MSRLTIDQVHANMRDVIARREANRGTFSDPFDEQLNEALIEMWRGMLPDGDPDPSVSLVSKPGDPSVASPAERFLVSVRRVWRGLSAGERRVRSADA